MKARIIRIGNSRGIRLPQAVLEQAQLTEEPREGWEIAFRRMAQRGDDTLSEEPVSLRVG